MEITIGHSTFYLDRIVFAICMQICWTLIMCIGGITSGKKKEILLGSALSLLPMPILMMLFSDFTDALILAAAAAVGCGIALQNRRSVGATFAITTIGSAAALLAGSAIFGAKTGQWAQCVICIQLSPLVLVIAATGSWRRRLNGELPGRVGSQTDEYDDGSSNFGHSGSGFGPSSSGF
jgi:hypothetical protein